MNGETSLIRGYKDLATKKRTYFQTPSPDTSEQNSAAERFGRGASIITKAKAMSPEASLSTSLWPETERYAGYISNRTLTRQLGWKSPSEKVHRVKPTYAHLHVFGCRAYMIDKTISNSKKFDFRVY